MKPKFPGLILFLTMSLFASHTFAAQFLFTPRTSVSETYTDNVFLTNNNREDDFITEASAGFTAQLLGKTSGLVLSADPGYVWYKEYTDNNTWRLPASLTAYTSPTKRTTVTFADNFIRTEDPIGADQLSSEQGQVVETGDTTARRNRKPYYSNRASLTGSYKFGEKDRVYTDFVYGILRNDDNQLENNDEYSAGAGLDYQFTNRFGSQFSGRFTRGEYDQQSGFTGDPSSNFDDYSGSGRLLWQLTRHFELFFQYNQIYRKFTSGDSNDYMVYAPSAGIYYMIDPDTYLRVGPGYYYQDIENENNNENFFLNAEVSRTWNYRRGLVNLTGLAGITQNDFGAQNQGFQQFGAINGSTQYNFTRRVVGDAGAYYRISFTPGQSSDVANEKDQTDHRFQFNAGIGYLPTRWMNIRLGYSLNIYDSNTSENYYENRAMLTVTLQPSQPWRF